MQVDGGPIAERGARVSVSYTGYLNRGKICHRDVVITFTLADRNIIAGLSHGVEEMRVGGRRRPRIGPHIGIAACRALSSQTRS